MAGNRNAPPHYSIEAESASGESEADRAVRLEEEARRPYSADGRGEPMNIRRRPLQAPHMERVKGT